MSDSDQWDDLRVALQVAMDALAEVADRLDAAASAAVTGEPTKRLMIDIPESLHTRIKIACAADRTRMAEAVRASLETQWPADKTA